MKQRRLGTTGLTVSEICLGTMTFGSFADEATSVKILDTAYDAGVDFLDVAEIYPVPPKPEHTDVSPTTFAVAWTLAQDFVRSTIVGATRVEQLPDVLRGSGIKLSPDVLAKVDAISADLLYPMG